MLFWLRVIFVYLVLGLVGLALILLGVVWFVFSEGQPYRDLSTDPVLPEGTLEMVVSTDIPVGNVAVSSSGRIFFTAHPEANRPGPALFEWVDGAARAFPPAEAQTGLFVSPLGLDFDDQDRLWVIDPADHGLKGARLVALDIATGAVVHRHDFEPDVAPWGSFLQDLAVSGDGNWVYIADTGFWARRPALISYEVPVRKAGRFLNRHETTQSKNFLIRNQIRDMSYFGGLVSMKTGVDGIALGPNEEWLYFAAMNHDSLYRIPVSVLHNRNVDQLTLTVDIEVLKYKPLSDGIAVDDQENVYITDVEHQAIIRVQGLTRERETLIKDSRIRWADGLAFGPDGALYLSDSALPHLVLQDAASVAAAAPYVIWKFTPPRTAEAEPIPSAVPAAPATGNGN